MDALGWTLIHFVWQGILIGMLLAAALLAGNRHRGVTASRYRYAAALVALVLIAIAPFVTFGLQLLDNPEKITQVASLSQALASFNDSGGVWLNIGDTWLSYLLIAWFVGVSWGSVRLLVSWLSLYMIRHTGTHQVPLWLEQDFRRLRQECRIHRPVSILISDVVRVPLTAGWLQPIILLPATALTGLRPDQIRLILRHELAHIQRYDYLVNWMQNLVQVLFFYHPVVHWISRILNDERELCCDHEAIHNRCRPVDYAKILVKLQEAVVPQPALAASGKGGLYRRVQRLLNIEAEQIASSHDTSRSFAWVFTVLISAMVTSVGILGSPEGHASYADTHRAPIMHPLSDIPAMVERRSEDREQLIRYHQKTNFVSFQWPSALGPKASERITVIDENDNDQAVDETANHVSLTVLHQRMMHSVKQQLPDDEDAFVDQMVDTIKVASVSNDLRDFTDVKVTARLPSLDGLVFENKNIKIPEPYVKVKPKYPNRLSGLFMHERVDVAYSIGPSGQPIDITVLSLNVHQDFADAAVEALKQWRFPPVSRSVQKLRISQQFNFLQVQTSINSKCSVTGGRLCPKIGNAINRIQVNNPRQHQPRTGSRLH